MVRHTASNVAYIMHASVPGSSVMDDSHRLGQQRCYDDRSALLGYSSYDSDNESEDSVKHLTRVLGYCNIFHRL